MFRLKTYQRHVALTGERVTGWPVMTIIRGQVAMRDGAVQGSPAGRSVTFRS